MNHPLSDELAHRLRAARRVTVLTGAGTSAESGVPTFRDAQTGLWARFRPEELATPEAFAAHPRRVWEWYAWRRDLVARARPNAGHHALVELARRVPEFTLITQNVDGLHQRAGSAGVIELHGNLARTRCSACCGVVDSWEETDDPPPRCPRCGALLRPDVVWFGEALPPGVLEAAWTATEQCDAFLSIGTSSLVHPAASLPEMAVSRGRLVIEINPRETPLSPRATCALRGTSADLLPRLVTQVWG
jgi:NAD-dependent deacetylase